MKLFKPKNTRSDITVLPIAPGTLVLGAGMLLAFLLLLIFLNIAGMISLPGWVERILGTAQPDTGVGDRFSKEFLSSISGNEPDLPPEFSYIETDEAALKALLLAAVPADSYYQNATILRVGSGNSRVTQQIFRIVYGDKEHAEIITNGLLTKMLTANGDTVYITEGAASRHFFKTPDAPFTSDSELGIPSLSRMQRMLAAADEGKYEVALSATKNLTSIRVAFTDTASDTREVYEVIPDVGLIFAASSYLPGADEPYYMFTTDSLLHDLTGFDDTIFEIPNP